MVALVALATVTTACPPGPTGPGTPATIVVTTTADVTDGGDGLTSLREAMIAADSDGVDSTIVLDGGATHALTLCGPGALAHDEPTALTLTTTGSGRAVVQQTCASTRVFSLAGTTLRLEHLAVRGGRMGSPVNCTWPFNLPCNRGAGIDAYSPITLVDVEMSDNLANLGSGGTIGGALVAGAGATVIDSTFHDNASDRWGGAIASYGDLTVVRTTFESNRALEGNAVAIERGDATFEDSRFEGNVGGSGGAIVMRGSSLVLRRTVIRGNDSGGGPGAAVWFDNGATSVLIERSAIVQNTGRAGALTSFSGIADYRIVDSTITDNVATRNIRDQYNASAGGLAISGASNVTVLGSTIAHNSAPAGGGSNFDLTPSNGTTITLVDSIVSDPLGGGTDCALRSSSLAASTSHVSDASCDTAASGSAVLGPLVASGATWIRVPSPGSPVRDSHPAPCATPTDQLGTARPVGSGCDLGASEQ